MAKNGPKSLVAFMSLSVPTVDRHDGGSLTESFPRHGLMASRAGEAGDPAAAPQIRSKKGLQEAIKIAPG